MTCTSAMLSLNVLMGIDNATTGSSDGLRGAVRRVDRVLLTGQRGASSNQTSVPE